MKAVPRSCASSEGLQWAVPPMSLSLAANEVHVWRGETARSPAFLAKLRSVMGEDELTGAEKFRRPEMKNRHLTSRAMLRLVLARHLNSDPANLRFVKGRAGKPALHPDHASSIEFNLSHSADCFVIAVASGFPVGIDIESTERTTDIEGVAARFFAKSESGKIASLPASERLQAFFTCWTRKEAYAKAKGLGISIGFSSFEVPVLPGEPGVLIGCGRFPEDAGVWRFIEIPTGEGLVCSLAHPGIANQVQYYRCDPADLLLPHDRQA